MPLTIRQETPVDYLLVAEIIAAAFAEVPYSDQSEPQLVDRLRRSLSFIPELSIVAEQEGRIVGHILLTKITIENSEASFDSLALAPVSVHPDFQRQGIGGELIREAHRRAQALGYTSIVLIGHEDYYPRFGYELTSKYGIRLPFEAPEKNCMAIELITDGLKGVNGTVVYDPAFFENEL